MTTPASGSSKTGRPRGRRAAPKVPCDACITRATEKKDEGASIELCDSCTAALHRPRRKQQEPATAKKIRRQSNAIIDTALGVRTSPVDLPWSSNQQEQHNVQFFFEHSSPQLAGYFDSPFWQRTVLQTGRHEPAVRHAIAAIGALHEKLLTGVIDPNQSQDERTQFALEQCNKSIQHLVTPNKSKSKPDLQLMLTTCVLFTCFEALQGHCEQAVVHATQGYSLLQQYASNPENRRWDVGAFAVELDQLCLLMRRLQTKGLMDQGFNILPDAEMIKSRQPSLFSSLQQARSGLELVLNQLTVLFLDMELDDEFYNLARSNIEKNLLLGPWLADWEKAFTTFLSQYQTTLTDDDRKAAMILKAHHLVAETLANVDLSLNEHGWDVFHDKFAAIVNLATVILENSKEVDNSKIATRWKTNGQSISAPTATLSFSLGIVDPLYEVCARCRDSGLRHRALELLSKHPRQECVWSSWSAWKVGRFLMRLEETGSQSPANFSSDSLPQRRASEAWSDLSSLSTEPGGKSTSSFKKAIPRATARYALNPGLFEDWHPQPAGLNNHLDHNFVTPDVTNDSFQFTFADDNSAVLAAAMPDEFIAPTWIDFDGLQHLTDLPIIQETPPED